MAPARGIRAPPGTCSGFVFFFSCTASNTADTDRKVCVLGGWRGGGGGCSSKQFLYPVTQKVAGYYVIPSEL